MSEKSKLFFNGKKKVIGMVHLLPLPGNAAYQNNKEEIVKNAIEDAHTLIDCGVDAIMLENFSDWPQYSTEIPLEAYSLMVSIATRIREFCKIPFGVNIEMNAFVQEWAALKPMSTTVPVPSATSKPAPRRLPRSVRTIRPTP